MSEALIDLYNRDENFRALKMYATEVVIRQNYVARKSAKRMVLEYATLLIADPGFLGLSEETRSQVITEFFKYQSELGGNK